MAVLWLVRLGAPGRTSLHPMLAFYSGSMEQSNRTDGNIFSDDSIYILRRDGVAIVESTTLPLAILQCQSGQ